MASNRNKRTAQKHLRRLRMSLRGKLIIFLLVTAILGASLFFSPQIERAFMFDAHLTNVEQTDEDDLNVVKNGNMKVHFLDVGQGDCTIIELPDNKTMIIDGGEKDQKDKVLAYIDNNLGEDFEYFDYCVLTHTDSDHCGSLDDVLNVYPASVVYRPNVKYSKNDFLDPALAMTQNSTVDGNEQLWSNTATNAAGVISSVSEKNTVAYREFLAAAYESPNESKVPGRETKVIVSDGRRDDSRPSGKPLCDIENADIGYSVKFFAPLGDKYKDSNNYSNILTVSYNNRNIMLTGDAEKGAEAEFVEEYGNSGYNFDIDVLKLGHHGSSTSSSQVFLSTVMRDQNGDYSANYFVVSCGLNNSYGHPKPETLARLELLGVSDEHILRTDTGGTILLSVSESGADFNGVVAVAPSFKGRIADTPLAWWHLALSAEVAAFVIIFLIIGTKSRAKQKSA